jgi:hypothetical protein
MLLRRSSSLVECHITVLFSSILCRKYSVQFVSLLKDLTTEVIWQFWNFEGPD